MAMLLIFLAGSKRNNCFNPICFLTRCINVLKNYFKITKIIFHLWNQKIVPDLYVPIFNDCSYKVCHLPLHLKML